MVRFIPVLVALGVVLLVGGVYPHELFATSISTATTTINLSICGNGLVDAGELCDAPGETGLYSTTIAGRQCTVKCKFGPYCGDGILQTTFGEECDDANNTSGDFCSATCKIEPAGAGGGGGGGGSSGGGATKGGSTQDLGDSSISVSGIAYPNQQINFLLDTKAVGSVRANSAGRFDFATKASPGTATLGIWANDLSGNRSITLNNTFDVTQGAITNVSGILLPPTIALSAPKAAPGSTVAITGQSVPSATVEIQIGNGSQRVERVQSDVAGKYSYSLVTSGMSNASYPIKARSVTGTPPLLVQSNYSSIVQLLLGVDGAPASPADLSRDGKVNLTDFSILIYWWQTAGGDSNPPADINGNGKVSLEDFSILLFNWTG
jgi:cysteine-rich repeat protein